MAISFKQIIAPAKVDDVEAAQRRQALAEAMQQRAMQPNLPQVGGPVQAKYGTGQALADLANSLASSWNLKNANQALSRAQEARSKNITEASKRVAMSQPNMPMTSGPGTILSPLTPEEASADLGAAMGPGGAEAVAKALMERKLAETDPAAAFDREVKLEQIRAGIADRKEARAQRMLELQMRIASDERQGKDTSDLKRQLAEMQIEQRRAEERGRTERAAAENRAKADATEATKTDGSEAADVLIAQLRDSYDTLDKSGGIVSTKRDGARNIVSKVQSSALGQFVGGAVGTENQSQRESISQTRPLLLAAIKDATGMSARQMDSNAELKLWLSAATDPTRGVEENRRALDNIENFIRVRSGRGVAPTNRSGTIQRPGATAPAPASAAVPAGVDPAVWGAMTPEERALWQN